MVKGIIIDWDDTLVNFDYWQRVKWLETCKYVENTYGLKNFDDIFWEIFNKNSQYYLYTLNDTFKKLGITSKLIKDDVQEFFYNVEVKDIVLDGAEEFLKKLKSKRYKIALLTMGEQKLQEKRIELTGLGKAFDYIRYRTDVPKPHLEPFLDCMNVLGTDDIIAFGDDQRDLLAPYHLGKKCIMADLLGYNKPLIYQNIVRVKDYKHALKEVENA